MVFCYLYIHRGLNDIANTSILQLTIECGYKPDKHKGKINDRIISVLEDFKECGYISYETLDLKRNNTLLPISINIDCFDSPSSFAMIWLAELEQIKIQSSVIQKQKTKPESLLLLLSYIRVNQIRRKNNASITKYPEIFYKQHKIISKDIEMSSTTLKRCIDVLEKLNIIVATPLDRYQDENGRWHTDITIFTNKTGDWNAEIKNGIKLLKNKNKKPTQTQ